MAQLIIEVPDVLAAQVAQALRDTYPDVVQPGMTDGQVTRAVIAWLISGVLAQYQVDRVRRAGQAAVDKAQAQLQAAVAAADAAARQAIQEAMNPQPAESTVDEPQS